MKRPRSLCRTLAFVWLLSSGPLMAEEFNFRLKQDISAKEFKEAAQALMSPTAFQFAAPTATPQSRFNVMQTSFSPSAAARATASSAMTGGDAIGTTMHYRRASFETENFAVSFLKVPASSLAAVGLGLRTGRLFGLPLALRGGYTYLSGSSEFCAPSMNWEAVTALGGGFFEPYAALGQTFMKADFHPNTEEVNRMTAAWVDTYVLGGLRLTPFEKFGAYAEARLSSLQMTLTLAGFLIL